MRMFYVFEKGNDKPLTVWGYHWQAIESAYYHSTVNNITTVVVASIKPYNPQVIHPKRKHS